MKKVEFETIFNEQMRRCNEILIEKARQYADDTNRLHNFDTAAALRGVSRREALAGMMAKHTVSIYDMCQSSEVFPSAVWEEKITDHMNYLILLMAIVTEDARERARTEIENSDKH
jgi:hypothetical protein